MRWPARLFSWLVGPLRGQATVGRQKAQNAQTSIESALASVYGGGRGYTGRLSSGKTGPKFVMKRVRCSRGRLPASGGPPSDRRKLLPPSQSLPHPPGQGTTGRRTRRPYVFRHRPGSPDPATDKPHLSVSIRVHPWLTPGGAIRKHLSVILDDASGPVGRHAECIRRLPETLGRSADHFVSAAPKTGFSSVGWPPIQRASHAWNSQFQ